MKLMPLILFAIAITGSNAEAQSITPEVINSTGAASSNGSYRLDWSIGELALVNQLQGSGYIITNGFLQPEQSSSPADYNRHFSKAEILILPNPTRDVLEIDFHTQQRGTLNLRLYNIHGRVLYATQFYSYGYGHIEKINMAAMAAGTYVLRMDLTADYGSVSKTGVYKIVKL